MQVKDEGYIIKYLKYGENSLILTVLSQAHGKMTGFVKSAISKKKTRRISAWKQNLV